MQLHITQHKRFVPLALRPNPSSLKSTPKAKSPQISRAFQKCACVTKRYYEQEDLEARGGLKGVEEEIDKIVVELSGITKKGVGRGEEGVGVLKGEGVVNEEKKLE